MRKYGTFILTGFLILSLAACSFGRTASQSTSGASSESSASTVATLVADAQDSTSGKVSQSSDGSTGEVVTEDSNTVSAAKDISSSQEIHEDAGDYVWETSSEISIGLNGDSITAGGEGVSVNGKIVTITSAGTYNLSGSLPDGQIIVDTADEEVVRLILNGVELASSTSTPLYIANADKVIIILADGTENTISDATTYVFEDPAVDEPNAALFSTADLTIYGSGSLTVTGYYNDGIASKDGLIIASGRFTVTATDDGIRGRDYIVVKNGNISVSAQGDGLKSDNEEDVDRGTISVESGMINITAGGDAITAVTDVLITNGEFTLSSGGGSGNWFTGTTSAKGIKAGVNLVIQGGTFAIDSADDALNTNGSLVIQGGSFSIASGDDGMHADATLEINAGDIQITQSYEGIESVDITINGGNIHVTASDDGINVSAGMDGSGMGGPGGRPGGGPGQDTFAYTGSDYLYVNGGYIVVNAGGDGIDSNGGIEMTGGVLLVNGPTENMNGSLDFVSFKMTGGFLVASGSAGMAQAPGAISTQPSVLIFFDSTLKAGTLVHIQNRAGEEILTFQPVKEFQSLAFSSPELIQGETYEIYLGGSSTGTAVDSLIVDGSYTPGEKYESFTISSMATNVGSGGFRRRP